LERIEQRLQTVRDVAEAILNELPSNERGTISAEAWMQLSNRNLDYRSRMRFSREAPALRYAAALRRIERMLFKDAAIPDSSLRLPIGRRAPAGPGGSKSARELAAQKLKRRSKRG